MYCPIGSAGLALPEVQPPPVPVAVAADTIAPFAVGPTWIRTVTGCVSVAVPVKDGVVSYGGELGAFNVTAGAPVLTVKVTGGLRPVSPAAFVSIATAV